MNKAEKEYKISYKTYYNKRLKKSCFHNKLVHPLYIQVIFDRISIVFKSYYFELFSKPKYAIRVSGEIFAPDIKQIISEEKALIDFIINKNQQVSPWIFLKRNIPSIPRTYSTHWNEIFQIISTHFSMMTDYLF